MRTPDQRIAAERDVIARAGVRNVLDVGANVGDMTQMFLDAGAVNVGCIEPIPDIFAKLQARFVDEPRVWVANLAVTDAADVALHGGVLRDQSVFNCYTLRTAGDAALESSPDYRHKPPFDIQLSTIDWLAPRLQPDFIKIDVDGYEAKAMRGARETIHTLRPVIMLEISYLPKIFGDSCEDMMAVAFSGDYIAESMFDGSIYTSAADFMQVFPWNTSFDIVLWPSGHPGRPA